MYCTLLSRKINFNRNQTEKTVDFRRGKLLFLLSISNTQVVLFYDDLWFHHVNVVTMKVLYEQKLQGKPYKGLAISRNIIIVMEIQRKRILSIDLQNRTITEIYRVKASTYINPRKQEQRFSISKIQAFKGSKSFYLFQLVQDERKIVFVYFPSVVKNSKNEDNFLIRQFEAKNFIYSQFDDISTVVRYRQNPDQNGSFTYEQINLQSQQIIKHDIDYASFVSYSTVIEIKRLGDDKHLIWLNSKNAGHECILYNTMKKNAHCVFTSQNILLSCIAINKSASFGVFSFLYASTDYCESIKVMSLLDGRMLDETEARLNQVSVGVIGDGFAEYRQQTRERKETEFVVYSMVGKRANYIKLMEGIQLHEGYGEEFVERVANMLQ